MEKITKRLSLNRLPVGSKKELTVTHFHEIADMDSSEDVFVIAGKDLELDSYVGTAEVTKGSIKPEVGELWSFEQKADDTFLDAVKVN